MRRKDKEIQSHSDIESIIRRCRICRLALTDGNRPYIVPMCFGYRNDVLYFHCATQGTKLDILEKNNRVCFEFDTDVDIVASETPCNWSMTYSSVIGFGRASFVTDPDEKRKALDIICGQYMDHLSGYPEGSISRITVIRVDIDSMTGKRSP